MRACALYLYFRACYPSCNENLMQRLILIALVATVAGACVPDVHAQDQTGEKLLHKAAGEGEVEKVERLIASGVDVRIKNDSGETPLDTAIRNGATRMADLLRAHGGE